MRHPFVRLALNFTIYLVFGGAILAFTAQRGPTPVPFGEVLLAAFGVALWSGTLTTAIETRVVPMADPMKRAFIAAALGGLSLGGFATILSMVAWRAPAPGFIGIGLVAGALMQGARAFSVGRRRDDSEEEEVDPKQLIADGALVLDVRQQDEWDAGHLPQAKHLPLGEVTARVDDVEHWAGGKDKPIVVHCKMGGRAGRARTALLAAGFTNVVNGGGLESLK